MDKIRLYSQITLEIPEEDRIEYARTHIKDLFKQEILDKYTESTCVDYDGVYIGERFICEIGVFSRYEYNRIVKLIKHLEHENKLTKHQIDAFNEILDYKTNEKGESK